MMKKLLAIIFSAVMLLSLAACAEDITPKEDPNADIGAPDDAEKAPQKTPIPFEVGTLDVVSGEDVYASATADELRQNENFQRAISEVFIDVISDSETCREMISPRMLEAYENNELLSNTFEERRDCFYRYDDAFFEQKKLVSLTFWSYDKLYLEIVKLQSYVDADGTTQYHAILKITAGTVFDYPFRGNIVLEVDKDIDITLENFTVEIRDKRIGR